LPEITDLNTNRSSGVHSVSRKFIFALICVVTGTLFSFASIAIFVNLNNINSDLEVQISDSLNLAESSLVKPLWNFDQETIDSFVDALFLDESLIFVKVMDDSKVVAFKVRPPFTESDLERIRASSQFLVKSSRVNYDNTEIGTVELAMSFDSFKEALISNILYIVALAFLIILSISLTSLVITRRYISRPLSQLQKSAEAIAEGDLDAEIDTSSADEIGNLANDFSRMRDSIKDLFSALRDSNKKLEDNNQTLEIRVEERTDELAHTMKEAQEAGAIAEAANRAKSLFLANMSHELRTPLNAILGFTQLMTRDKGISKDHRENLGVIGRSGEHLLALINDVLDMSKIEAGQTSLDPSDFDLYRLLKGLEEMFGLRAEDKGLRLVVDCDESVPQFIRSDESKLRQVLINLLSNGIKFTAEGGVALRVMCTHEGEAARLSFEVEDSGPGIADDELELLFDAFAQTSAGQRAQEGTGLGLPISQQFVSLMDGEISVASVVGQGSIFKFDISIDVADAIEDQSQSDDRPVLGLLPNQDVFRILIVEDVWENRKLMVNLLQPMGFEVREAENGKVGVEMWEEWEPHFIWMDMRMPVMDGYEATKTIKATAKGQATVIVALTASAFEEQRSLVLSAGCDGFVRKPFRESEIFHELTKHLGAKFEYEEETPTDQEQQAASGRLLTPADLSSLPEDWVDKVREAASQADSDVVSNLISEIENEHSELAEGMKDLVDTFRFDRILTLTE
jgi:signal transduction histidine kinase/DNA-binding NarL/FixJ family response regulator